MIIHQGAGNEAMTTKVFDLVLLEIFGPGASAMAAE
jgi:hypothetical protein